jgi:multimeric flavodoxin WrbA
MSNVKVLGISGSPRIGKNTAKLLEAALEAASAAGAETKILSLSDVEILPCIGCNTCVREKRCSQDGKDDMPLVKEMLESADAIIFAAPSYFGSVPGVMKNMMDRSRSLKMDDHKLKDKVVSSLSIAGLRYGGAEHVVDQLARFGLMHGMVVVGGVGDPFTDGYFGIASLQGDAGWRRVEEDKVAIENARGVGRRVAEVAWALREHE